MYLYVDCDLRANTTIEYRSVREGHSDYISVGIPGETFVSIEGTTDKLCQLHDKLGQLIHARMSAAAKDDKEDNPLNLADETADVSEEIKPF